MPAARPPTPTVPRGAALPTLLAAALAVLPTLTALPLGAAAAVHGGAEEPGPEPTAVTAATAPRPPAACTAAWAEPAAASLVEALEAATEPGPPVWADYGLESATVVLSAGEAEGGGTCLGVWRGGAARGYAVSEVAPRFPTRLYGYLLPWEGNGGPFDPLVEVYRQPSEVRSLLHGLGVRSAVLMPVEVKDFPFQLDDLRKVQTAVHEAFHVEVEAPRWLGPGGDWPPWDLQPDRDGLPACYAHDADVEAVFAAERRALERLVQALLDDDRPAACAAGRDFLRRRSERHALLGDVTVDDHAGEPVSCRAAETIMELEEGVPDFASWSQLYHRGIASREELMGRYRIQQAATYYLTGAMQAHALHLLDPDGWIALTREIAASASPREGSLTVLLERELAAGCGEG